MIFSALAIGGYVAKTAAAGCAIPVARRRADYRPVAMWLTIELVADLLRIPGRAFVIDPFREQYPDPKVPLAGLARVAQHVDEAFFLLWAAGIAALALVVFLRPASPPEEPPAPLSGSVRVGLGAIAAAWAALVVVLTARYPDASVRGEGLARAYLGGELAALAVAAGALLTWIRRLERPRLPHIIVLLLLANEAAALAVPWRGLIFGRWPLVVIQLFCLYALITLLEVREWIASPSSPR